MNVRTELANGVTRTSSAFASGARSLLIGFSFWKHRPGYMLLGLLPAAIAGVVLFGALALLLVFLEPITTAITPFANDWDPVWATVIRFTIGLAMVIVAALLTVRLYTAVALMIGGPIYERIGTHVDEAFGRGEQPGPPGFWRSLGDMMRIVLRSILGSIAIGLVALIPVVGGVASTVLGVLFTADVIAREFTLQAMHERGLDAATRAAVLKPHGWARLGFGLAVQLCYLVPLGAVLVMPSAVAGGTHLARRMLGESVEVPR